MATLLNIRVEQLLALFVTRALGFSIDAVICDAKFPSPAVDDDDEDAGLAACAAWKTDRGTIKICGRYDAAHSQRINEHVIYLEWWIEPSTHHANWYRSSVERPGEWTAGHGRRSSRPTAGFEFEEYSTHSVGLDAKVA